MPDKQPNIPTYLPADLLRYATGRMAPAEMHALEKAALEDPFLEEALEGYMGILATQSEAEVQAQANRLVPPAKKQEVRVVPLWQRKGVQLAIAALLIAGGGWFIFSLLQKPSTPATTIAQQAPAKPAYADTSAAENRMNITAKPVPSSMADSAMTAPDLVAQEAELNRQAAPAAVPPSGTIAAQSVAPPVSDFTVSAAPYSQQRPLSQRNLDSTIQLTPASTDAVASREMREPKTAMRSMMAPTHIFKARIMDAKNNPVPYANVMIEGQNFGTYSDLSGYFNFVSDDSILPIRVRSVGYTNQVMALHEGHPDTKIILQEDQQLSNSLPLTVQAWKKITNSAAKSIVEKDSIMGMETATVNVPYYDLYLLNNNRISPLPTLKRQVQLSFDVSKSGEATNITVVQSSGKVLDQEAIRLVKEGPKLISDSTIRSRKKVTVQF